MPQVSEHRFSVNQTVNAPRDLVWACWTDMDYLSWLYPREMKWRSISATVDPRPLGLLELVIIDLEGNPTYSTAMFTEVFPKEYLSLVQEFPQDPLIDHQKIAVSLRSLPDGGTELDVDVLVVCVDEYAELARSGMKTGLGRLGRFAESGPIQRRA